MTKLLAITAVLLSTSAYAQPYPGPGPLIGSGAIQGPRSYDDWQQTRRDHGLDYDNRSSPYQPYPSISPPLPSGSHLYDPLGTRHSPLLDDDN